MKIALIVFAVLAALVAAFGFLTAYVATHGPDTATAAVTPTEEPTAPAGPPKDVLDAAAYVTPACEDAVRDQLPTPRTAHFPFGNSQDVDRGENGLYRMSSTVEWTSGAGVPMRSTFVCDATKDGRVQRVVVR